MPGPRVAILGVILESNRQAPVAGEADFRDHTWLEGAEILAEARKPVSHIAREAAAFVATMDATGTWEPIPVLLTASHPAGPIDGALMDRFLDMIGNGLRAAGPLDAVYIANHGGMIGTDRDDTDGEVFALAREIAGANARIVATLDLHANISDVMVESVDLIVGYRTNPHVDMQERGEEAALALRLMLAGQTDPKSAFIRLPLTPASVSLLTASGPYGDLIDLGVRRRAEAAGAILNVSIFGGFVFSDSEKNGVAIIVTARDDKAAADVLARDLAIKAWDERQRFVKTLTPLSEAVKLAREQVRKPLIFSDAGDNPGGGGTGRTTELLSALVWSGAEGVLIGAFFDSPLAEAAHRAGVGGHVSRGVQRAQGLGVRCAVRGGRRGGRFARGRFHRAAWALWRAGAGCGACGGAADRRCHRGRDLAALSMRGPDVLRGVRARYRGGAYGGGEIARAFSRGVPAVVSARAGDRSGYRRADIAGAGADRVDAIAAPGVSD